MYLSRVSVRPEAKREVAGFLAAQAGNSHNLIWTVFGDHPDRDRDFLYRDVGDGSFMVLSERAAADKRGWFTVEQKPFAPQFRAGQVLGAIMRVNATTSAFQRGKRGRREDLIGRAIRDAKAARGSLTAEEQAAVVQETGYAWFARKGAENGFVVRPAPLQCRIAGFGPCSTNRSA